MITNLEGSVLYICSYTFGASPTAFLLVKDDINYDSGSYVKKVKYHDITFNNSEGCSSLN